MLRKFLIALLIFAIGLIGWYLFLKTYDYTINFKVNNRISQVFYEAGDIRNFGLDPQKDKIIKISSENTKNLTQQLKRTGKAALEFDWNFTPKDSFTNVTLHFSEKENKVQNRLAILNPFSRSEVVDSVKMYMTRFARSVKNKSEIYKVEVDSQDALTPEQLCICHTSENIPASQKALEMVATIDILEDFFLENNLKRDGFPFVKVSSWNKDLDLINFEFCYPIQPANSLVGNKEIQVKTFSSEMAIKASFYGNYRMSHLAWQEILYQAEKNGRSVKLEPLEIFYNNPNTDPEPLKWKAEIFMPLK